MPRTIIATFAAAFLLIGGAALAIACDGGTPAWGNAGGDEYHHECEGGDHSGYNYFGGGKDDCGNCDDSHFSGYSSGVGAVAATTAATTTNTAAIAPAAVVATAGPHRQTSRRLS